MFRPLIPHALRSVIVLAIGLVATTVCAQTVDSVAPETLRRDATTEVLVRGTELGSVTGVAIGGSGTIVSNLVVDSALVVFDVGVGATAITGTRDLTLQVDPDVGEDILLADALTVVPGAIDVFSVEPTEAARGDVVTLNVSGSNLDSITAWSFGDGIDVLGFDVSSPTRGTVSAEVGADAFAGFRAITASRPDNSFTLEAGFRVLGGDMRLDSVTPDAGTRGDTVEVRLDGENLDGVDTVSFGPRITVTDLRITSPTTAFVTVTPLEDAVAGSRFVFLRGVGPSAQLDDGFSVLRGPMNVTEVRPDRVRQGDVTYLTIDGENLDGLTALDAGTGIEATGFDARSATTVTVDVTVSMDAPTGFRDLTLTAPAGTFVARDALIVGEFVPPVLDIRLPTEVDVGDTQVGATRRRGFSVGNGGEQTEIVRLVAVDGDSDLFALIDDDGEPTGRMDVEIPVGGEALLTVAFSPVLRGRAGVEYEVTARGGEPIGSIIVRGTGQRQELTWSVDPPYDYGVVPADEPTSLPRLDTTLATGVERRLVLIEDAAVTLTRDGEPFGSDGVIEIEFQSTVGGEDFYWGDTEILWDIDAPSGVYEGELVLTTDSEVAPTVPFAFSVTASSDGPGDPDPDVGDVGADVADGPDAPDVGDVTDDPADTGTVGDVSDDTRPDAGDVATSDTGIADAGADAGSGGVSGGCCSVAAGRPEGLPTVLAAAFALVSLRRRRH